MRAIAIFLSLIFILPSCKVQYGMVDGSIDASTFTVSIFEEQAANAPAGYGANFSNFLKDFVLSRTKLNLTPAEADIEISGKILQYNTTPVSVQSGENGEAAALNRLTVTILVSVINNRDEDQSFESNFSQFSDYSAGQELSSVETALLDDINTKLSQDIINKLTSNW
jgi:hypothetical protein